MMISKRRIFSLAGLLFIACHFGFSQKKDKELWSGATFKLDINKDLRVDVEEQVRFNNNISRMNVLISEAGVLYDLNKHFSVKGSFRYSYDPESHNKYRYTADMIYEWSKKGFPLDFKYRLRFQQTFEEHTRESESYFRNKVSVDYNMTKFVDPYISFEPYFKLNGFNEITNYRFAIGLDWDVYKDLSLETFYMFENEFGEPKPKLSSIIGLGLSYRLEI
ncbi:MAG: DUF2490 domain-containing protein [Bacteroidales bacterium]|nr:DUF2490 domain-containing protein [Bacteroidales bacterium]